MGKKRILVIDDDEVILKIFKEILEMEGYTADTAKTGKEAIEKSYANLYNMALIDIRLPDMDGTQLLTRMRETVPKMVKIIVTGFLSTDSTIEATRGADGYVTKPIMDTDEFLSKIKEHLKTQEESESQKQS